MTKAKADAVRLLRQIVAPCDGTATEHGWRKCKRCTAVHGVEMRFPLTMRLLQTAIDSLEAGAVRLLLARIAELEAQHAGAGDLAQMRELLWPRLGLNPAVDTLGAAMRRIDALCGAGEAREETTVQEAGMENVKAWIRYETRTVNVQGELTVIYPLIAGKAKDPHHHWTAVKEKLEAAGFRVTTERKERSRP